MTSETYCCSGMKEAFSRRYERSLFIFSDPPYFPSDSTPSFWLAMRVVEKEKIKLLSISAPDTSFTIATRVPIRFCPWCGVKLVKYYKRTFHHLHDKIISDEFINPESRQ